MGFQPKVIPVEIFPANWCIWCDDPDHSALEACNILSIRQKQGGIVVVEPCGCTINLVVGNQGDFVLRVMEVQKE